MTEPTNTSPLTQSLSEDLKPYAEEVLAMDPFEDVEGASAHVGSSRSSGGTAVTYKIEALPPELQTQVRIELRDVPDGQREQRESEAVLRVLKERVHNNRAETGIAANSSPYHKALVQVAGQARQLDREIEQYEGYLADVKGHETVTDPETGEKKAQPIPRVTGARREGFENHLNELKRQRRLWANENGELGLEAAREVRKALEETARLRKEQAEAAEDAAEVKRQVAARLREDRIQKQVRAQLNLIDPDHGK